MKGSVQGEWKLANLAKLLSLSASIPLAGGCFIFFNPQKFGPFGGTAEGGNKFGIIRQRVSQRVTLSAVLVDQWPK